MISAFANKTLRFLSSEVRGLQAAAYVLAIAALLASLLALVRDRLLAHEFGASATLDIYYAGFRIPDLIFVATGALVSVYMLIPELSRRTEDEQKKYIDTILVGFFAFAVIISGIAALCSPVLLPKLFPHFSPSDMAQLIDVTRILLLQPIFLGLSNILAAITQARHRYALYALSPLLYNLGIIAGVSVLYPIWGLPGLAFGVVFGAALHFAIQIPSIIADGFFARIPRIHDARALVHTAVVSVPRSLALSMTQIAFFGLVALAGGITPGAIAVFVFGYNLQGVPLSIIGASYSVAAFPTLAKALSMGEREAFIEHVATAARYVFFWSLPASALILVLRAHVVRVILGSGLFDWTDTRLTAAAFALLSLSLVAQGLTLLLVRGYYAAGRTLMPFVVAALNAALALLVGYLTLQAASGSELLPAIERWLRVEGLAGSAVLGLAFAYAFASVISTVMLAVHFEMQFRGFFARISRSFFESALAAIAIGCGTYITLTLLSPYFDPTATASVFAVGFIGGLAGIAVGAFTYFLLGSREFGETMASIAVRIWRKPEAGVTIVSSAEEPGNPVT